MDYKSFYRSLLNNRLISPIWEYVLSLLEKEIEHRLDKDSLLIIFAIYFSLIDDGNVGLSLDKNKLLNKWKSKMDGTCFLLKETEDFNEEEYDRIRAVSEQAINDCLDTINQDNLSELIGEKRPFDIDESWLYVKKYNHARLSIRESIKRIFSYSDSLFSSFDCLKQWDSTPSSGQVEIVKKGLNNNLIITGGPGTGKTASVILLLISLLTVKNDFQNIYMVAPSGKASSRIKESVENNINKFNQQYKDDNKDVFGMIDSAEELTIHRLLGIDAETCKFRHNKDHQFDEHSIFIIDEASMIDISLFASLLEAIPDNARVFILGDKNQLPSVESGAVFADLLKDPNLKDNIVELDESIRFTKESDIYYLADEINNNKFLVFKNDWKSYNEFKIEPTNSKLCPVYYYKYDDGVNEKGIIERFSTIWGNTFFKDLENMSMDLDPNNIDELRKLFDYSKESKILTTENDGIRGVNTINALIKKKFINKTIANSFDGHYPGQLMMINKNNNIFNLYNGDSGLLVTFKNDPTIYFMVEKNNPNIDKEEKTDGEIFKIDRYTFYPLSQIKHDEIDLAYAITIHKSQGSEYTNILVILPNKSGHPLLNRQIVYTAITRTKGNTYILSSKERLEEAKNNFIQRDTNIV